MPAAPATLLHLADVDLPGRLDAAQPAVHSTGDTVATGTPLAAALTSLSFPNSSSLSSSAVGPGWQAVRRPRRELHGLQVLHGLQRRLLPKAHALLCRVSRLRRADGHRFLDVCRLAGIGVALPTLLARRATAPASRFSSYAAGAAQTAPAAAAAALARATVPPAASQAAAATASATWRAVAAAAASVPLPGRI